MPTYLTPLEVENIRTLLQTHSISETARISGRGHWVVEQIKYASIACAAGTRSAVRTVTAGSASDCSR